MIRKYKAFTLFEILIAVFIFAILGTLAGLTLHNVIRTHQRLSSIDRDIMAVQIALLQWDRNVSAIVDRPITSPNGRTIPAVASTTNGVTFTAFGHLNPGFTEQQSFLARMGYIFQNGKLVLQTWTELDPTADAAQPLTKVLLDGVQSMQIQYVDQYNRTVSYWPEQQEMSQQQKNHKAPNLPKAIILNLSLKRWGTIKRVMNLAGATRAIPKANQ